MQLANIALVSLFILATAQEQNLTSALSSNEELSRLSSLFSSIPKLVQTVDSAEDVIILAPTNTAIDKFLNESNSQFNDTAFTDAILRYHVLDGRYAEKDISEKSMFIPTLLRDDAYVNVTGGQRVQAARASSEEQIVFYSGYNSNSTVVESDIRFSGGLIHVVDTMLVLPQNVTATSISAGLTSLVGAVRDADFKWNDWGNATFFAPKNEAFRAVGSAFSNMTMEELHTILMYHVINDTTPIYTTRIDHADWITTTGTNVTFTFADDGTLFVNSAAIIQPNVLVANGVIHIIDNVLNPNGTSTEAPSGPSGTPAFENSTSLNTPPFTSGVPSTTATVGTGPTQTPGTGEGEGAEDKAIPMATGAVGLLVLLLTGTVMVNL